MIKEIGWETPYIDRFQALCELDRLKREKPTSYYVGISAARDVIYGLPSVSWKESGEWIRLWLDGFSNGERNYTLMCPVCNFSYTNNHEGLINPEYFHFCPNCGAKMSLEGEK